MKRCKQAKLSKIIILTIALFFSIIFVSATVLADQSDAATVSVDNELSADHNVIVFCDADFNATHFEWDFGDGSVYVKNESSIYYPNHWIQEERQEHKDKVMNSQSWNGYHHSYLENGTYQISCYARDESGNSSNASTILNISTEASSEEIAAAVRDDPGYYNPYVYRSVLEHMEDSTYRYGGYAIGVPRNEDNTGQSGYWAYSLPLDSPYTSTHPNIFTLTFPEPGDYNSYQDPGINWYELDPAVYRWGMSFRGCSNPRSTCYNAQGGINFTMPDLGTRDEFGILTKHVANTTYNISCQNYASDAGLGGRIAVGDGEHVEYTGNEWITKTYEPGNYTLTCWQELGGLNKRYDTTLEVTDTSVEQTDDPTLANSGSLAISELGYHPEQTKKVIVYTDDSNGTFDILSGSTVEHSGALETKECQGGQPCLVGDFSDFSQQGTYTISALGMSSPSFTIGASVFADNVGVVDGFFDALRMQGSSYHPDHHAAADPPFTMTQDGSFLLTTNMATMTLIRMGQAYEMNPTIFSTAMQDNIISYVEYLEGLQDHDGTIEMPDGWFYDFGCPLEYDLDEGKYNDVQDDCLLWVDNKNSANAAKALAAYMHAMPALAAIDESKASQVLTRAINTHEYIESNYGDTSNPSMYGAALFLLYDFTGEENYLQQAYDLHSQISTSFSGDWTEGDELYWNEYIKHRDQITSIGTYQVNGDYPEQFFADSAEQDWASVTDGEGVYIISINRDFQHTRPMLLAAIHGEFAAKHTGSAQGESLSEAQLAWLTGQNRVDWGDEMRSRSFIFGIGENGRNQHVRFVPHDFFETNRIFLNGEGHISGWTSGAYDLDGDGLLDYRDGFTYWRFVEGTSHMTSLFMLHLAQIDARYNDRTPLSRPFLEQQEPVCGDGIIDFGEQCDDGNTMSGDGCSSTCELENAPSCVESIADVTVTCEGGSKVVDSVSGTCRTVECSSSSGLLRAKACDKGDGPDYFEIYKQEQTDNALDVCFADTCLDNWGYKRSTQDYPICSEGNAAPEASFIVEPSSGDAPLTVDFDASSSTDADGDSLTYVWAFGDGAMDTGVVTTHTYNEEGTFTATLTVSDGEANDTASQTIFVGSQIDPGDPGAQSTLFIESGSLSGDDVADQEIVVEHGASITGDVTLNYDSAWSETNVQLVRTPSWGSHETSYSDHGSINGVGSQTLSVSEIAPSTSGTYYLLFAYRAEIDAGDVASMTNWNANPEVWNDGNDLASFSQSQIDEANAVGRTTNDVLFNTSFESRYVPSTIITIIVEDNDSASTCAETVGDLPAICEGGVFTTDSTSGSCRTLACEGSGSSMQVLACDKPDGSPEYFEMYKQSQNGNGIQQICLAGSCITNGEFDGFERGGNYPICSETTAVCGDGVVEGSEQCDDGNIVDGDGCSSSCRVESTQAVCGDGVVEGSEQCDDGNTIDGDGCSSTCQLESTSTSADLRIKEWYPQGLNVVLVCEESGYDATSYFWNFGDGDTQTTTVDNVYHNYDVSGTYDVMCEASNGATESDTLQVTVSS